MRSVRWTFARKVTIACVTWLSQGRCTQLAGTLSKKNGSLGNVESSVTEGVLVVKGAFSKVVRAVREGALGREK